MDFSLKVHSNFEEKFINIGEILQWWTALNFENRWKMEKS